MKKIGFLKAVTEAVNEEMQRNPRAFILGEDVRIWGGPFGEFSGMLDKFGPERVRDTPISEAGFLGSAIGAAATGMHPIASMMIIDFMGVCADQLINQLQMRYMYGGMIKLPLTIMATVGCGMGAAAQHSKTLFGWLMSVRGLKLVTPSNPYDAKGLLKAAIREENPVFYAYHKSLLFSRDEVEIPEGDYTVPIGKADVKRQGSDVTVVAISFMVQRALAAAQKLQEKGISVEVVDPRSLMPLDKETILNSVKKTGKLVIIDEEPITGSAANNIAAMVAEEGFDLLDAPIKRVCAPDTPVPFSPVLENAWVPGEDDLIKAITEIV